MFLPTETQFAILELLQRGLSNKTLAARLSVTEAGIEYHVHRLFAKTGTSNRVELAIWWQAYRRVNPFERALAAG